MNASTTTVTISAGGYTAEIATRGGQLLSLTSQDPASGVAQNLIVPAARTEGAFAGAVLAPWPNRIAEASYSHGEQTFELPVNEEETGAALHGLLYDVDLNIQLERESEVHLGGSIEPTQGYPFRLEVALIYRVAEHLGLSVTLSARHAPESPTDDADSPEATGVSAPPFGAGFHPYLTAADAPLRSCRLRLPAETVASTQANGKVLDRSPVSGDLDLTDGPLLAGLTIDHAYTDLPQEGWTAELLHGPSGLMVRMIADTPWAQVYTGDEIGRAGVAVEPMTCPPDAFNSGENLVHLESGDWFRVGYSLEALRL